MAGCWQVGWTDGDANGVPVFAYHGVLDPEAGHSRCVPHRSRPCGLWRFVAAPRQIHLVSSLCRSLQHGMGDAKGMEAQIGTVEKDCDFDLFWKKWHFDITTIKCPAILIHGQYDQDVPIIVAQHNTVVIKGSMLITIAGSSHTLVTGSEPDFPELLGKILHARRL